MFVASLAVLLLTQAKSPEAGFRIWKGPSGPRVPVRFSRPTFQWQIWADDPARKVVHVQLAINNRVVAAKYDPSLRAVVYTPSEPLTSGSYRAECRVVFDNGSFLDEKWETTVAASPLTELPVPDQEQREALAAVNRIRVRLGQPALAIDDRLSIAAVLHSKYLAENKTTGHHEEPTKPGYFGATGAMRLEAYGYVGRSWEGVEFGSRNPTEAVRSLFDAPLHRIPFLQPGKFSIGSGYLSQYFTIEFGEGDAEGTVISPANGESEVPAHWRNYETPNPLKAFPEASRLVGYPIVLARFGWSPKMGTVSATLLGPYGEEVPCYFVPPSAERTSVSLLIPRAPLERDASYAVHFVEILNGREREFRSVFRTGKG